MAVRQILTATQTTSDEFNSPGTIVAVIMTSHSGGTWKLQVKAPDDTWVDDDPKFTKNDVLYFYCTSGLLYRLTGGTAGATAWLVSTAYRPGVL